MLALDHAGRPFHPGMPTLVEDPVNVVQKVNRPSGFPPIPVEMMKNDAVVSQDDERLRCSTIQHRYELLRDHRGPQKCNGYLAFGRCLRVQFQVACSKPVNRLTTSLYNIRPSGSILTQTRKLIDLIIRWLGKLPGVWLFNAIGKETTQATVLNPRPNRRQDRTHAANERKPSGRFFRLVRERQAVSCSGCGKREDHDERRESKDSVAVGLRDGRHNRTKQA